VTKGAPQVILELSANARRSRPPWTRRSTTSPRAAFVPLGVARADGDGKWQLLGVLPLFDPPREDAKETIATAARWA
jgi:H+-transporting ATPase